MKVHIRGAHEVERLGWTLTKAFFFVVIAGAMINASIPAVSRGTGSGAKTLMPGIIRAARTEVLTAGQAARVVRLAAVEGASLRAGDLIAELESPELDSQLEAAARRVELARLRAAVGARAGNSEYAREQAAAAERSVESVRRRLSEYSIGEQEAAYASAQARTKQVAALVERRLATAEELESARRAEQNELRTLQMDRLTVNRLREDLESARSQQRMVALAASGPEPEARRISELELAQAQQEYEAVKARYAQLRVVAPFSGVLLSGLARANEMVAAGGVVARVADTSALVVEVQVAANVAQGVAAGSVVQVRLPGDPPQTVKGTILTSALAADVSNGGYILRVGIPGAASYRALAGMEATVELAH